MLSYSSAGSEETATTQATAESAPPAGAPASGGLVRVPSSSAIHEISEIEDTTKLNDNLLERIKNNHEELLEFVEACSKVITVNQGGWWVDTAEVIRVARLQGKAELLLHAVVETNFTNDVNPAGHSYGGVPPDFQVKETSLTHEFDLMALVGRCLEMFEWYRHEEIRQTYLAPYFPLIQSSGMGKTKLLYELRQYINMRMEDRTYHAILVLCSSGELEGDMTETYNEAVELEECMKREPDPLLKYREVEKELEHLCRYNNGKSKVVLLFDEAQNLLVGKDNYLFNCIQWWLAKKFKRPQQVVAVFAGTTLQFALCTREPPESTNWGDYYMDGSGERYPPFYQLHTMGCLLAGRRSQSAAACNNEMEESYYYGRPLFAKMGEKKLFADDSSSTLQTDIVRRLILSHSETWQDRIDSCFSVLATRVQMGQTSFNIASELVSRGYAVLSSLDMDQRVAEICHLPDPICAKLAMCLMKQGWQPNGNAAIAAGAGSGNIEGQCRSFWVTKMAEIFADQTCIPSAGDVGEVFAALYILFCGDILRFQRYAATLDPADAQHNNFSVSLCKWIHLLINGGRDTGFADDSIADNNCDNDMSYCWDDLEESIDCTICFIQVTQNYLRYEENMSHWTQQHFLRHLYQSRSAFYVFEDCSVFDIFASIRYDTNANNDDDDDNTPDYTYYPLLISIVCLPKFSPSEATSACCAMEMMLTKARCYGGLCILLVLGRTTKTEFEEDLLLTLDDLQNIPTEIVSKVVEIPNDDTFDITRKFWGITSNDTEEAEIFASHSFIGWNQPDDVPTKEFLRVGKRRAEAATSSNDNHDNDAPLHYLDELRQNIQYSKLPPMSANRRSSSSSSTSKKPLKRNNTVT